MQPRLCLTAIVLIALPAMLADPQDKSHFLVRGEIVSGRFATGSLTVELSGGGMPVSESVAVRPDNTFEFRSVSQGMHQLRVLGSTGQILHEEFVSIVSPAQTLSIRITDPPDASRAAGSVVSVQSLRHKVPPAARKAFDNGEQAVTKGDLVKAQALFGEAVTIDPEFADAYNELGGVDAELKHLPEAAEQFQKAVDLVPEHPMAVVNLSIVLARLQRLHEAGQVARRALQIAPADGRLHYILGASLLQDGAAPDVIIAEFERATASVRAAHIIAAELLAKEGRQEAAIQHLETYLSTAAPDDALRGRAEAHLAALRK